MAQLSSNENEQRLLALLMQSPIHLRVNTLDLDVFAIPMHKQAGKLIKEYVQKYKKAPSKDALRRFAAIKAGDNIDKAEKTAKVLECLDNLPTVSPNDADFEFDQAENFRMGRALYDTQQSIGEYLQRPTVDFREYKKGLLSKLSRGGNTDGIVRKAYLWETVQERYDEYKKAEKGERNDNILFGIKQIDEAVGGMRKTFVTLLYSKTGGGKSRTKINIALNAAMQGYHVAYFSLEMSHNLLGNCFDSRLSFLDSNKIIFGKLDDKEKNVFKKALVKQTKEKLPIYVYDVAKGCTPAMIEEELENYRLTNDHPIDLCVIDYANIMEPNNKYVGRSEKYDVLFKELHELAKSQNVAVLTSTQESRDATKEDINAKNKKNAVVEQGVHKIGLSNFMAPHCETIIRLKCDDMDKVQGRMWAIIDKCRYGRTGQELLLVALFDRTYVGDTQIDGKTLVTKNVSQFRSYQVKDYSSFEEKTEEIKEEDKIEEECTD